MAKTLLHSFQAIDDRQKQNYQRILCATALARLIPYALIYIHQFRHDFDTFDTLSIHASALLIILVSDTLLRISHKSRRTFCYCGFVETFLFQVLVYRSPFYMPLEFLFVIGVMLDVCFLCPMKFAIALNAFISLIWTPLMSYSFYMSVFISSDTNTFPFSAFGYGSCITEMLICTALSMLLNQYSNLVTLYLNESKTNHNLDVLNRSLSSRLFAIQAEAEQKAKREVTKYVHDNVGYIFTNLIMMLQATEAIFATDSERSKSMMSDCINYACRGMDEIRSFLRQMHQHPPERLDIQKEIFNLARLFERCTGVEITIAFNNWPTHFSPQVTSFFLSFTKEGLTNAVKHGMATQIHIFCVQDTEGRMNMSIHDNGTFNGESISYGLGLQGIKDALEPLNGTLTIVHDGGFLMRASLKDPL